MFNSMHSSLHSSMGVRAVRPKSDDPKKQGLLNEEHAISEHSLSVGPKAKVTGVLVGAIFQALIGVFIVGYNISLFNIPETIIRATATEFNYISEFHWEIVNAMFPIGAGVGAFWFTGTLADKYGRRKCILFNDLVCIVGSIITTFSYDYVQLLVGRLVIGVTSGASTGVTSVYLNEISPIHLRGIIGTTIQLVLVFAVFISEVLGGIWITNNWLWRVGSIIPAILASIQLGIGYFALPVSPPYRASVGDLVHAKESLRMLRGDLNGLQMELGQYMTENEKLDHQQSLRDDQGTSKEKLIDVGDGTAATETTENSVTATDTVGRPSEAESETNDDALLKRNTDRNTGTTEYDEDGNMVFDGDLNMLQAIQKYPVIKQVFFISLFVHVLQQLSGIDVVFYYSQHLLEEAGVSNAYLGSISVAAANFLFVLLATWCIEKAGRRPLFLISAVCMVIADILLTIMFVGLSSTDTGTSAHDAYSIGAIMSLVFYVISFELGLGPITWLFVAEITPIEYRGKITSIAQMVNYSCNALVALTSTSMLAALGDYGFVPFAVICFFGAIVTWKYLPETRSKTVKQILNELKER